MIMSRKTWPVALALAFLPHLAVAAPAARPAYADVLAMRGTPEDRNDRSFTMFFDAGAWHGYSLPPKGDLTGGFTGPFIQPYSNGSWVGATLAAVTLSDAVTGKPVVLTPVETATFSAPGYLQRSFAGGGVAVRETLYFADSWHSLVRVEITSVKPRRLRPSVQNVIGMVNNVAVSVSGDEVVQTLNGTASVLRTKIYGASATPQLSPESYEFALPEVAASATPTVFYQVQTYQVDPARETPPALDVDGSWAANRARWAGYLKNVGLSHVDGLDDAVSRHVAVKAIETLLANWRAARGDLRHDGMIPSQSNGGFNGFWAWDSWKHAAAAAHFAPELAKNQVRAMFDYQDEHGMIPDVIFMDKSGDNWRNTKPPLAGWAVREIYRATGDKAFLAEMYDRLKAYHQWWYAARDHDRDGLCEYGSTDGTRAAAAWESGMDNAVRYDHAKMLDNGNGNWSTDQDSVDLNAYLYDEKLALAEIAGVLGKTADQAQWLDEAATLKTRMQAVFYDPKSGYFFDRSLTTGQPIRVFGPEGWLPLWAGVATPEQARAVRTVMMDPKRFNTKLPFPTLSADHAQFSPVYGYWRGPVWLDQAQFGVEALSRYGFKADADAMARKLIVNAQGLTGDGPVFENYDPLTGRGHKSRNFGWAAAHDYLLVLPASQRQKP